MLNNNDILNHIINLGQEITNVNDVDLLLKKILKKARGFTNADAGSIYIRNDNMLQFSHAQNDTLQQRLAPGKKLIYSTFSVPIEHTSIAGYVAKTGSTLNIADVYKLEPDVPYRFDDSFDQRSGYTTRSMLCFPLKNPEHEVLGVLQLINARDADARITAFSRDDEPYIMHFANSAAIALERAQMTRAIILRMLRMAEMRDPRETGGHVNRVGACSVVIYDAWAAKKGHARDDIEKTKDILRMAAMLHDVGKVAISDTILKKPQRLESAEYETMKQHTFLGARLFLDCLSEFDRAAFHIALEHHERWDGTGYPGSVNISSLEAAHALNDSGAPRKKGADIHPFGRIVAIADVYDALSSRRCYKEAWGEDEVLEEIRKESGRQFDPEMVEAFFEAIDEIRNIRDQYPG